MVEQPERAIRATRLEAEQEAQIEARIQAEVDARVNEAEERLRVSGAERRELLEKIAIVRKGLEVLGRRDPKTTSIERTIGDYGQAARGHVLPILEKIEAMLKR